MSAHPSIPNEVVKTIGILANLDNPHGTRSPGAAWLPTLPSGSGVSEDLSWTSDSGETDSLSGEVCGSLASWFELTSD